MPSEDKWGHAGPWTCLFKFYSAGCAQSEFWLPAGCGSLDPEHCVCMESQGPDSHLCQSPHKGEVLNPRDSQGGKDLQVTQRSPFTLQIRKKGQVCSLRSLCLTWKFHFVDFIPGICSDMVTWKEGCPLQHCSIAKDWKQPQGLSVEDLLFRGYQAPIGRNKAVLYVLIWNCPWYMVNARHLVLNHVHSVLIFVWEWRKRT